MMSWIMSIAAGLAIGYFIYQMVVSKNGGVKTTGRIHNVCGGIAEYLNADPTIIRLVFALMVLGWGTGVLAYIACALILPEGDSEDTEEE